MYMNRSISRVLAAAVASAGFVAPAPTIAATLTCTASTFTATASGGNINVSCTSPSTTPTCSLTANNTVIPATGGSVTLTASNCGTISSWTKSASTVSGQTSTSLTDTFPANTGTSSLSFTYTVSGDGGSDSVTVTQSAPGGGTTSPPPPGACPGFANTRSITIPWGAVASGNVDVYTSKAGGFGPNDIVVAQFTTPATTAANVWGKVSAAENGGGPIPRTASLSLTPCDFPSPNPIGGLLATVGGGSSPSVQWAIGGSSVYYPILKPNTTYYFNIKNQVNGVTTCSGSACNMIIELQKPNGL